MNASNTMVWASAKDIREKIAGVPENWLVRFALAHPCDVRKLGDARNATLLYRVSAVLERIEDGSLTRTHEV